MMPTKTEFENLAKTCDAAVTVFQAAISRLRSGWSEKVMAGGRSTTAVQRTIDASETNLNSACAMVQTMSTECLRRAQICAAYQIVYDDWKQRYNRYVYLELPAYRQAKDGYDNAMTAYSQDSKPGSKKTPVFPGSPPGAPTAPVEPPRPFPWVEPVR